MLGRVSSENDLTQERLSDVLEKLSRALAGRVEKALIFGSAATGQFTRNSDIDLILIEKSDGNFLERPKRFLDLYDIYPRLDVLVYTPQEFANQLADSEIGFWRSVRDSLKQIV